MSRWDSSTNETAAAQASVVMLMFAELDLPSGTLYVHDGIGTFTWGGHDWLGVGQFGSVNNVQETLDSIALPVDVTLSGVETQFITDAMETQYHGRDATLYVGLVDPEDNVLLDTPQAVWDGYMDVMTIEVSQGSASITLRLENRLRRNPASARYTQEDQQLRYPTDTFLEYLHTTNQQNKWGGFDTPHYDNPPTGPAQPDERRRFLE